MNNSVNTQMKQDFEEWYGFEVNEDMDIQTSVAWNTWKRAYVLGWRTGVEDYQDEENAQHKRDECIGRYGA